MVTTIKQLVDVERGLIDRRIYSDPDIYQQELEQVWGRCWIGVGHQSQIPNPNDFTASYIGEDPVLVTRDAKGKMHAFLNMCRHRGNRICRADRGNSPSFMCTYHGWTFATDGKLVGVPGYKEAYFEELDRSQWGLVEARVDSYKGVIFATWDMGAPSLLDYLGDMAWYMDLVFDRRAGGSAVLTNIQKRFVYTNWKIPSDNISDNYHAPITHASGIVRRMVPVPGQRATGSIYINPDNPTVHPGNGHTIGDFYIGNNKNPTSVAAPMGMVGSKFKSYQLEHSQELKDRLGDVRARQLQINRGNIFPSTSWIGSPQLRLRMPRGPLAIEMWSHCLVDKDAPEDIREDARRSHIQSMGPSGMTEMDDINNWNSVAQSGKTMVGRRYPMDFSMGLGRERKSEIIPGTLFDTVGEHNQREFYGRWAEIMDAASWDRISLAPRTMDRY